MLGQLHYLFPEIISLNVKAVDSPCLHFQLVNKGFYNAVYVIYHIADDNTLQFLGRLKLDKIIEVCKFLSEAVKEKLAFSRYGNIDSVLSIEKLLIFFDYL